MSEERLQILRMLEAGKITVEEAVKLLDSVEGSTRARAAGARKKMIRIRIMDGEGDHANVNLPVGLARIALGLAAKFEPRIAKGDFDEVMREIEQGAEGRLVEIVDGKHKVEVYVE